MIFKMLRWNGNGEKKMLRITALRNILFQANILTRKLNDNFFRLVQMIIFLIDVCLFFYYFINQLSNVFFSYFVLKH